MSRVIFLFALIALLNACGSSPPAVSSVAVTGPTNNALKLGQEVQFTAAAKDSSGNTLEGKTFTWVSSDPAIAAVAADGKVTGLRNGKARISATADGVKGESAEQTAYGLEYVVGANLVPIGLGNEARIMSGLRLQSADGSALPEGKIIVKGPAGFNNGANYEIGYGAGFRTGFVDDFPQLVAGTYTATVTVGSETFTATSTVSASDLTSTLPRPSNIALSAVSGSSITASWSPVAGAVAYRAIVRDSGANANASPTFFTTDTSFTLTGLTLNTTKTDYFVLVTAFNHDWRREQRQLILLPGSPKASSEATRVVFP